ncbi:MAG TPA: VWA domain-containing protein [Thermoanaerobaculia bacterium]|nr:VWA domain-containing protein [Thermoanaerobaculia bacterium]
MLRVATGVVLGGLLLLGGTAGAQEDKKEKPPERFTGEITVSLVPVVVRVLDGAGNPVLGLKPADFRVRAGKREVPVVAVDWIGTGETVTVTEATPAPAAPIEETVEAPPPVNPGKLVVFFVQADLIPSRISGQLRLRPYTRELLGTLRPEDLAAVVSFDSHLKLWQDFTADRTLLHDALDEGMLFSHEHAVTPSRPVSLAEHFDREDARRAASPEQALEIVGRALQPLPGEKTLIFLGYGLGRFGADGVKMTPDYKPAVHALGAAHASVFVLDITSADEHSLEVGLEAIADATGGLYLKTYRLPEVATNVISRAISGHYVLTLDRALLPEETGELHIDLREKSGNVLMRPVALR